MKNLSIKQFLHHIKLILGYKHTDKITFPKNENTETLSVSDKKCLDEQKNSSPVCFADSDEVRDEYK